MITQVGLCLQFAGEKFLYYLPRVFAGCAHIHIDTLLVEDVDGALTHASRNDVGSLLLADLFGYHAGCVGRRGEYLQLAHSVVVDLKEVKFPAMAEM